MNFERFKKNRIDLDGVYAYWQTSEGGYSNQGYHLKIYHKDRRFNDGYFQISYDEKEKAEFLKHVAILEEHCFGQTETESKLLTS